MGRKRKTDRHLPERMYLKSGSYYFVDYLNKWHNLGRHYVKALAQYGQFTDPDKPCRTVSDLLDRYLVEVAPLKAENSYKANISGAKYIRAASVQTRISSITDVCCAWRKSGARVSSTIRPSAQSRKHWKKQ